MNRGGEFSAIVRRLVEQGLGVETGETWTYEAMSTLSNSERMEGGLPQVQHALMILARRHGREFINIRKVGYRRLDDAGIVEAGDSDRHKISRRVSRARLRTSNVQDWQALSQAQKQELDTHRTVLSLMRNVLKRSSIKRIREGVIHAQDQLDLDKTLALFRTKGSPG